MTLSGHRGGLDDLTWEADTGHGGGSLALPDPTSFPNFAVPL